MNAKEQKSALINKSPPFWRNSLYEEPTWVSLAWTLGPVLVAGILIYFVVR